MAINKITETDLENKGVVGQAEVPGLPAAEMQYKVEEIVRDVAIPKINEVIEEFENVDNKMTALGQTVNNTISNINKDFDDFEKEVSQEVSDFRQQLSGVNAQVGNFPNEYVKKTIFNQLEAEVDNIPNEFATKQEVKDIVASGGHPVTTVFGRLGDIKAQAGDYTAAMVGAAPTSHTHTKAQITDFPTSLPASDVYSWAKASTKPSYNYSEVGAEQAGTAASAVNSHNGNSGAHSSLFAAKVNKPTNITGSGSVAITLSDNCIYEYNNVTSLTMTGANVECMGTVHFSGSFKVTLNGFTKVSGDDPQNGVTSGQTWEFNCFKNRIIWKNWG